MADVAEKLRQLTSENEALRRENEALKSKNSKLKQSLDESTRMLKAQRKQTAEANARADAVERQQSSAKVRTLSTSEGCDTVDGLQRRLSQTNKRLSDHRKLLSDMRERLAVIEQVVYNLLYSGFYRAMHYSAKRGLAITCRLSIRPSVRPSVCL